MIAALVIGVIELLQIIADKFDFKGRFGILFNPFNLIFRLHSSRIIFGNMADFYANLEIWKSRTTLVINKAVRRLLVHKMSGRFFIFLKTTKATVINLIN